ncbi:hypothetical protein EVAR_17081_1 [Eumeta japonica]|uniref:Mariner Mos1 transposase n=1 Tax=Eumeta variegata TaxID=151549 RepID=A0A4C1V4L1_EUMVA|nr:hypothetical protein EVAR_17081_1 [Eumeta japonica]
MAAFLVARGVGKSIEEIRQNKRQRRIILLYDNASCPMSAEKTRSLEGQKIELTGQPPYAPIWHPTFFIPNREELIRLSTFLEPPRGRS